MPPPQAQPAVRECTVQDDSQTIFWYFMEKYQHQLSLAIFFNEMTYRLH